LIGFIQLVLLHVDNRCIYWASFSPLGVELGLTRVRLLIF